MSYSFKFPQLSMQSKVESDNKISTKTEKLDKLRCGGRTCSSEIVMYNTVEMIILLKQTYRYNTIQIRILAGFLEKEVVVNRPILKFIQNHKVRISELVRFLD